MRIVIVGGGRAAASAVDELRALGHDDPIDLFCAEPHLPYNRPPLSKGLLLGVEDEESIFVHDHQWYLDNSVELHLGATVTGVDLGRRQIRFDDDDIDYDRLLIATGASPRRLAAADEGGGEVAYLRTLEDSRALRAAFRPGQRILIVGAGWIGLEVAAAARIAESNVTVVEPLGLPLARVLGPEIGSVFADLHRAHGVDLRLGTFVESFEAAGPEATQVRLDDGSELEADLVVVGIGVTPNDALAKHAGLQVDNGILVDWCLRSSDPHVYAAGDVANHLHPALGRRIRVEHWDTAIEQGKVVARNLVGAEVPYARMPYFFTDQYERGMEYVGSVGPDGYDELVLRGDPADKFSAFWLKDGRVVAGMHVDDWDAIDSIRAIVGTTVALELLRDESTDLETIAGP